MKFLGSEPSISLAEIEKLEKASGFTLPISLRELYILSNGGSPEPYVFENDQLDTVVSELLPIASSKKGTSINAYQRLVLGKKIVPRQFFPFAIDGGGDYFFADCTTSDARVFFYRSDTADADHLLNLDMGLEEFWSFLKSE